MSILQGISGVPIPERQKPAQPQSVATQTPDLQPAEGQPAEAQPVASLLEYYRSKHSAWVAEAESLARLRDQVRSAADRESLEIITQARKDVRDVIAIARRELLVLTEQVRAALGDSEPPPKAVEALKDDGWLPAAILSEAAESQDIHTVVTVAANPSSPPAVSVASPENAAKREDDWGDEFDSLLRQNNDRPYRW